MIDAAGPGGRGIQAALGRIEAIRGRLRDLAPTFRLPDPDPAAPTSVSAPPAGTPYRAVIEEAAARHGVDRRLVDSVVRAESGYRSDAVSPAGAQGLMQIMPQTASMLGLEDPFDPEANVDAGTRYLRSLLDRFGDVPKALAAYNAGPSSVERHGGVPPIEETRRYVDRVMSFMDESG